LIVEKILLLAQQTQSAPKKRVRQA